MPRQLRYVAVSVTEESSGAATTSNGNVTPQGTKAGFCGRPQNPARSTGSHLRERQRAGRRRQPIQSRLRQSSQRQYPDAPMAATNKTASSARPSRLPQDEARRSLGRGIPPTAASGSRPSCAAPGGCGRRRDADTCPAAPGWQKGAAPGRLRPTKATARDKTEPDLRPITPEELSERIRKRQETPFSVWDGRVRLSIAGYQDKIAVHAPRSARRIERRSDTTGARTGIRAVRTPLRQARGERQGGASSRHRRVPDPRSAGFHEVRAQ